VEDLAKRIEALERRLREAEDQIALQNLMASYGPAVDTGDSRAAGALFAEEGEYRNDGRPPMSGRAEVEAMVESRPHQRLIPDCAHIPGPATVRIDGDLAWATGYSRVELWKDGSFSAWRVSANHWCFERRDGRWQILRRETYLIGTREAQELLRRAHHPVGHPENVPYVCD
jgi:ketosteroid isomerase-like protein